MCAYKKLCGEPVCGRGAEWCVLPLKTNGTSRHSFGKALAILALAVCAALAYRLPVWAQEAAAPAKAASVRPGLPPRVVQAERFLARRGWSRELAQSWAGARRLQIQASPASNQPSPRPQTPGSSGWQQLGPTAVQSLKYGLVTGRVSALALDPADPTGNRLFVGTTGGGVWLSENAGTSNPANIVFAPLTDSLAALNNAQDASISIGALTVQPGGTGVILAGTGDPNDALDSYYGAGILRSADDGNTWSLIPGTEDKLWRFSGEGFAGFAWSTVNPQLVVAAVSQAYEGTLVNAEWPNRSYMGLYYSADGGANWSLATIADSTGNDVQGPLDIYANPHGNAATSVVWNPVRRVFVAAVRFHGYYQSKDGITWMRMAAQPGSGLTTHLCPTNANSTGSPACPIYRGTLAVNPLTGDTFAWTVDIDNQDQGIWQDQCVVSAGVCTNKTITFAKQWTSTMLETSTALGAATIQNGDYNLALAAVPSGQDTVLVAGANDLWKCSLAMGCSWRNTTNAQTCMSAEVAGYQHALEWSSDNPLEIFVGNDSGLWRSTDVIGESGPVCSLADASHFQNLNGSLGSLAEVVSMSQAGATPYTLMAGLGANGTAAVDSAPGPVADWPQVLGGEGGPVSTEPFRGLPTANWYVNNQAGVSIYRCAKQTGCTLADFGSSPAVSDADVGGDGLTMTSPAPFLVDPLDKSQLLVGTCRVWRGPAGGQGWNATNAISPILGGTSGNPYCSGDPLIRALAAMPLASGGEVIYAGLFGSATGGANLAGHVLSAIVDPAAGGSPDWQDLTLNPVTNDIVGMNAFGLDISSIFIDPHDQSGKTVYVTVAGIRGPTESVQTVYRSTDGGMHWVSLTSNLPASPANSLAVDPQDAATVYVATDRGVYSTQAVATCAGSTTACWSPYGSGLPQAPVVELSASPAAAAVHDLVAATYGRGIWAIPLLTAATNLTAATATPVSLSFPSQAVGTASSTQTVTLKNTGAAALLPTSIVMSGEFSESDNCQGQVVVTGSSCAIQVSFRPNQTGTRTGVLTISANVAGGQLTAALSGYGTEPNAVTLSPVAINFGAVPKGGTSKPLQVTATNTSSIAVAIEGATVTDQFVIASNSCGNSLAPPSISPGAPPAACQMLLKFAPTRVGAISGTLTMTDAAGVQTVALSGTGQALPTDILSTVPPSSPLAITFPGTATGQLSSAQTVTLTNSGDLPLESITASASGSLVSGEFQISNNNCTTQLAGHSSCAISVVFAPTQLGIRSGTLSVGDITRAQPQTVALSGTGLKPAAFGVSPTSLNFASQPAGQASPPLTVTVSNTGGVSLANVGLQITGPSAKVFSVSATTCGTALASGASCTAKVVFTPVAAGGATASLVISSSTGGVKPVTVPLSGAGQVLSGLGVSPSSLIFPTVAPGQASPAQTVKISNSGAFAASALTLAAAPPFSLVLNTCGASLAAGANCSTGVVFSPSVDGNFTGALTIASPTLALPASVPLSGTGGVPGLVQVQPALLTFPQTGVGLASSPITITITNPSPVTSLKSFSVSASAGFRLMGNACPATLAPLASCAAGVVFAPTAAGSQSGNLTVSNSLLPAGSFVPMSGMGFDFNLAPSGASSLTVASGQTANFKLTITPLLGSQGVFTFQCGTLPPNAACVFNPASEGIPANSTSSVMVQVVTGRAQSLNQPGSPPRSPWSALPLVCGLVLLPFALGRRRRALLLVVALAILAGGVSSCTASSGGLNGVPPASGPGITPPATYTFPVTVLSNGVQHQVTLTLTVD